MAVAPTSKNDKTIKRICYNFIHIQKFVMTG